MMPSKRTIRHPLHPCFREREPYAAVRVAAFAIVAFCGLAQAAIAEEAASGTGSTWQAAFADIFAAFHGGGLPMWGLAAILATGVYEGVWQLLFLTRKNHLPRDFEKDVVIIADTKGMDAGIALCKEKPSSLARVLQAALIRHGAPLGQLETAVRNETALARYVMLRRTRVLGWLTVVAPILGMLGLVANLTRHTDLERVLDTEAGLRHLILNVADGFFCFTFSLVVSLIALGFYFASRALAFDLAHDIEVRAIDAVVTLDRKARQSIRLIEDIEEKIKTESMIKVPDLSAEFEDASQPHESALKTNVTTHAGGPIQA